MATSANHYQYMDTPVGTLRLEASKDRLTAVYFADQHNATTVVNDSATPPVLSDAKTQLNEYFAGDRKVFSLPLEFNGTRFEIEVWNELEKIPYGVTVTYKDIAEKLGDPNKVRAVGRANGCNPLPIVVPCHRVIGSDHNLVGYAGGIERKRRLLQLEGALLI